MEKCITKVGMDNSCTAKKYLKPHAATLVQLQWGSHAHITCSHNSYKFLCANTCVPLDILVNYVRWSSIN